MRAQNAPTVPDDGGAAARPPLIRLAQRLLGRPFGGHHPDTPPDPTTDRIGADVERRAALDALAEPHHLDSGY